MVTQEDPQEPAYSYPRGSRFFDYYKRENQLIWEQCELLDIGNLGSDATEMGDGLKARLVEFLGDDADGAATVEKSLAILAKGKSPYA
ncbi:MAG: hypothetical protein AAGI09_10460 [Pseudomonadota bacterium]